MGDSSIPTNSQTPLSSSASSHALLGSSSATPRNYSSTLRRDHLPASLRSPTTGGTLRPCGGFHRSSSFQVSGPAVGPNQNSFELLGSLINPDNSGEFEIRPTSSVSKRALVRLMGMPKPIPLLGL